MAEASASDNDFAYFIKKVLTLHFASPQLKLPTFEVLPQLPSTHSDAVTDEVIESFVETLWFKAQVARRVWSPYFTEYASDVVVSDHSYVTSLLYMCEFVRRGVAGFHEGLTSIVSAVAAAAVFFHERGQPLAYAAPVLITYFDTELKDKFHENGGWRGLKACNSHNYCVTFYRAKSTGDMDADLFESYVEYVVHKTQYRNSVEYIIPHHIQYNSRCNSMAKAMMERFFPEKVEALIGAMEKLKLSQPSSSEAPAHSIAGPSGTGVVQTAKESGQASVSAGSRGTASGARVPGSQRADPHQTCGHRETHPFVEIPADSGPEMRELARLAEIEKAKFLRLRSVLHDLKCSAVQMSHEIAPFE